MKRNRKGQKKNNIIRKKGIAAPVKKILEVFEENRTFLISGHIRPDGDTVGSALALASWLEKMGKKAHIVSSDPVPEAYSFLPGVEKIRNTVPGNPAYDVGVLLECPDMTRVGAFIKSIKFDKIISIDHHPVSTGRPVKSDFALVDQRASSCSELIYMIMRCAPYFPDRKEALCLYTAIVTDTGRFQQANTTPRSMNIAAELLGTGIDTVEVYRNIYGTKRESSLKLLGQALCTLQREGAVSYMKLTRGMYEEARAQQQDAEEIVNYAGMAPGTKIYALFSEIMSSPGKIKVSLRSYGNINVNAAAAVFGGGGHFHASGFEMTGPMDDIIKQVLPELKKALING